MSVTAADVSVAASVLTSPVVVSVAADDVSVDEVAPPDVSVAASVLTSPVVVSVAAFVLSSVVVVSDDDDAVSVDEIELAVSGSVAVASEGVSDTVVLAPTSAAGAASAEGVAVSTVWSGGAGRSAARAGAIQLDAETTPTIKTTVPRISRSSRRRRPSVRCNAATLRVPSFINSLLYLTTSDASLEYGQSNTRKQGCKPAFRAEFAGHALAPELGEAKVEVETPERWLR
jgi:hypothetical protein